VENVSGFVKKISSNMVVAAPKVSNWPEDYGMAPMVDVNIYQLDKEYGRTAYHTIKKIHEAIVKKEMPLTYAWS
jgi:hypothetical protein